MTDARRPKRKRPAKPAEPFDVEASARRNIEKFPETMQRLAESERTPPKGPVHLYFLTSTGEVRSGERYRFRNGEWRSALTGCVPRLKVAKWETETSNG